MVALVLLVLAIVAIIGAVVYYYVLGSPKIQKVAKKFAGEEDASTGKLVESYQTSEKKLTDRKDSYTHARELIDQDEQNIDTALGIKKDEEDSEKEE